MNDVDSECPEVLREPVSHARRLAIFIGNRDFERRFAPWSTERAGEVAVFTREIVEDLGR
jgi:hypothetical protein